MFEIIQDVGVDIIKTTLLIVIVFTLTYILANLVRNLITRTQKTPHKFFKVDMTHLQFLKHFMTGVIYFVGISVAIYMVPSLRKLSVSLLAGAGILAVIVGFASQQAFSNIISGIFITMFRPFRVGDWIRVGETLSGIVEDITLRHTLIRNFNNKMVVVPNSILGNEIIENAHMEDQMVCEFIEMGISYDSDIDQALSIMAQEAMKHPSFTDKRTEEEMAAKKPAVKTKVIHFGDSSVNLRAWGWAKDPFAGDNMRCDLYKSIKERFDKEGVEIPYPHMTIVYKETKKRRKK